MKKIFFLMAAILVGSMTDVSAQEVNTAPFLTDSLRPNGIDYIAEPPAMTSGAFYDDFYYYQWGKEQRQDADIAEKALSDEGALLRDAFSEAFGLQMTYETTPEILKLVETAINDAYLANKKVKDYYQRKRPFAQFNEPSLKPEEDETEALTFSYPSGHTSRGWMVALVLSTIAPERTAQLMVRAQEYALNRVICGHHWKSDTEASLVLIAGVFSNVVVCDGYQAQLKKAREEYKALKGETTAVRAAKTDSEESAAIYDLQGRRYDSVPSQSGVYVHGQQKILVK